MSSKKKEDIYETTLRLIVEQGVHATPMSQIAKEAGTGVGTIYNYFPTKENLIRELYARTRQHNMKFIADEMPAEKSAAKQRFHTYVRRFMEYSMLYPREFLFLEALYNSTIIDPDTRRSVNPYEHEDSTGVFAEAQKQNLIKESVSGLPVIQYFLSGCVTAVAKYHLNHKIPIDQDTIRWVAQAAWDAIKK